VQGTYAGYNLANASRIRVKDGNTNAVADLKLVRSQRESTLTKLRITGEFNDNLNVSFNPERRRMIPENAGRFLFLDAFRFFFASAYGGISGFRRAANLSH